MLRPAALLPGARQLLGAAPSEVNGCGGWWGGSGWVGGSCCCCCCCCCWVLLYEVGQDWHVHLCRTCVGWSRCLLLLLALLRGMKAVLLVVLVLLALLMHIALVRLVLQLRRQQCWQVRHVNLGGIGVRHRGGGCSTGGTGAWLLLLLQAGSRCMHGRCDLRLLLILLLLLLLLAVWLCSDEQGPYRAGSCTRQHSLRCSHESLWRCRCLRLCCGLLNSCVHASARLCFSRRRCLCYLRLNCLLPGHSEGPLRHLHLDVAHAPGPLQLIPLSAEGLQLPLGCEVLALVVWRRGRRHGRCCGLALGLRFRAAIACWGCWLCWVPAAWYLACWCRWCCLWALQVCL